MVYARPPDGQPAIGPDRLANATDPLNFIAEFEPLRQPVYPAVFYYRQWLALSELARQRGETGVLYLRQTAEFVAQTGQ